MSAINDKIAKRQEQIKQSERLKKEQDIREKNKQEAVNTRRNIIIGKMVCEYFPDVLNFYPRRTEAENKIEFLPFEQLLYVLANDNNKITQSKNPQKREKYDEFN